MIMTTKQTKVERVILFNFPVHFSILEIIASLKPTKLIHERLLNEIFLSYWIVWMYCQSCLQSNARPPNVAVDEQHFKLIDPFFNVCYK